MSLRPVALSGLHIADAFMYDIARGIVPGGEPYGSYGERTTAGAESNILWPNGTYALPPAAGVQLSLVSASASDAAGGTGIRTLEVEYLDANLDPQTEVVTLNGLTPVSTVATNVRFVECMRMVTYGSGKAAAGAITASSGGQAYSYITAGARRCSSSVRMVPRGKRAMVTSMYGGSVSGSAAAKAIVRIVTPNFAGRDYTADSVFFPLFSAGYQDNSSGLTIPCPLSFTEGQVIGMAFEVDKAATVTGSWFGWLEPAG